MTATATDLQFVLPRRPRSAVVLGGAEDWGDQLAAAGIEVASGPAVNGADLVVARAADAARALALGAPMVVLAGRPAARVRRGDRYALSTVLAVPSLRTPNLLVPLRDRAVARYALRESVPVLGAGSVLRKAAAVALVDLRLVARVPQVATLALRRPALPFPLRAATRFGIPDDAGWYVAAGQGAAEFKRNVFHVFPRGAAAPGWVVKVARRDRYPDPFAHEERGLAGARAAGARVTAHAPRHLGRFVADGLEASVETAAVGARLADRLAAPGPRAGKTRLLARVVEWTHEVAAATARPPGPADVAERRRILTEVIPPWRPFGAMPELDDRLSAIPVVFQHNDLWSGNVVVDREERFVLVDWEEARADGFPLFDVLQLLADALPILDGLRLAPAARRVDYFRRLFRGETRSSPILHAAVRRAAAASGLEARDVGPLATLCWLERGFRPWSGRHDAPAEERPLKARLAHAWLGDPLLGTGWSRWAT